MSILLFLIIFSIVVLSHEFGHFIVAKANGIKVIEFAMGMGPAIIKFQKGETLYALRLFPIGGACVFENEDGLNPKEDSKGSFQNASVWARIATVFAGPLFNFIIAFLFSLILVGFVGSDTTEIYGITENSAAFESGLQKNDEIIRINGERVHIYREISLISFLNRGEEMQIEYQRNGTNYSTKLIPKFDEATNRYYIGLQGYQAFEPKGLEIVEYSYYEVRYWIKYSIKSIQSLFTGQVSKDDVSGPIGIAQMVGDVYEESLEYGIPTVIINMMNIAVLISVNLGVINLLPLPALDGGRLMFMFLEALRGKPIPAEKEGIVHFIGFVALMILMVFIVFNDIMKLFM